MDIKTFKQHGLDQAWDDLHVQSHKVNGRSNAEILEVLDTAGDAHYHPCAEAYVRDGVLPGEVAARLSHVMPISPVSDLRPLLQTSMNEQFRLDMKAAEAESPVLMRPLPVPVTVWVGAEERPVFLDQARWLAEAWSTGHEVAGGRHHFDVIEALEDPASRMVGQLLG